jgi:hypothetical protein
VGAEPRRRRPTGATRPLVLLTGTGLLLTGCASMPDSGDIRPVKASPRADSQVRVYAVPPRKGATPEEIVDGFLEAMTSDDAGFATARTYLSPETSRKWRPEESTTVLAAAPDAGAGRQGGRDNPGWSFPLYGRQIAAVDEQHSFRPTVPGDYTRTIHLSQYSGPEGKEWRIDSLPPGLVLGQSDFQRNYRTVNKFYFAAGQSKVVADPVFIRQRIDPVTRMDPVTQSVKALLDGPTDWLKPVVESPFPSGTALAKGVRSLTVDDRSTLKVPLNAKASGVGRAQCTRMAVQILYTIKDLTSTRVEQVELQGPGGSQLCVLPSGQAEAYAADSAVGRPVNQYFVDADGRLAMLPGSSQEVSEPLPVPGPFGEGRPRISRIAVAHDERTAAAVSQDHTRLQVASITDSGDQPLELLASKGKDQRNRLSAPSWDGFGDLWIADRDPERPALYRFERGAGRPHSVAIVPGLDGARVESLRISADGARIALLLEKDGRTTLRIGRVERQDSPAGPVFAVAALRSVAPQMETVTAVSWAGPSRLVLVGREEGGVPQVRYMQTDGSTSATSVLPGLNRVRAVAATGDENRPLVAYSEDDGIVRLPAGANWQTMVKKGSSPVYPG